MPLTSRHPKARGRSPRDTWWPAHELGHLLTVPRARIGQPLFGMDVNVSPFHPSVTTWWAYELAAMHVSRRLLIACDRPDLFFERGGEPDGTDWHLREYGSQGLARRIDTSSAWRAAVTDLARGARAKLRQVPPLIVVQQCSTTNP